MQRQADGRYFEFGSKNNSEASIWLEKIIIDGKWSAPSTGTLGCSSGNINGSRSIGSVSSKTSSPQDYIYLEWYAWREMARMKAKVKLPDSDIVNELLLNPPWLNGESKSSHKSVFIIDFRRDHKVWIKLSKNSSPKSQDEIMILAEGQGVKTDDIVTRYRNYKKDENYTLDCASKRKRLKELGAYTNSLEVYDKWYTEFIDDKEGK
ncbi:hypothetical protein [Kangiella shandongensis]|uniref:hypothetical protein n=1 Tax=Kangiella shandongensis TaxID=2763258 RepID=UPI001CBC137C|nr:hypothetical protein [Kangiella shandongensis]